MTSSAGELGIEVSQHTALVSTSARPHVRTDSHPALKTNRLRRLIDSALTIYNTVFTFTRMYALVILVCSTSRMNVHKLGNNGM